MKEWHRGIKRELDPERQRRLWSGSGSFRAAIFLVTRRLGSRRSLVHFAPLPEQEQASRDGVKQPALSHEHRQRNAFPSHLRALVISELKCLKKLKADETTVEQKACDPERATPSVESVKRRRGSQQTDPDQAAN